MSHKRKRGDMQIPTLIIKNFGKNISQKAVKKALSAVSLNGVRAIRKPFKKDSAFIEFDSIESREKALESLKQFNSSWEFEEQMFIPPHKKFKKDVLRDITEIVTPLAHLEYTEQLKKKEDEIKKLLYHNFFRPLYQNYERESFIPEYLKNLDSKDVHELLEFENIKPSPVIYGYRNHCEFTCGYDVDGNLCVGFLHGRFVEGYTSVASPQECKNVSDGAKEIVKLFNEFIKTTNLPPYQKDGHKGFWRQLKVRENIKKEYMIVVQVKEDDYKDRVEEIKKGIIETFQKSNLSIISIYYQNYGGVSNAAPVDTPLQLLYGKEIIIEELLGLKFQISPTSFFQVNTKAAEVLYSIARDWACPKKEATLLDICCGTGTIGLTMSNSVNNVIGIEMVPSAVEDAKKNASLNDIKNAKFICGKAEDALDDILKTANQPLIAIVDPPRAGLHPSVNRSIRKCTSINRLVYVSCNPKTMIENALVLCGPSSKRLGFSKPFKMIRAVPVDMFPHCEHCEMVVLFER